MDDDERDPRRPARASPDTIVAAVVVPVLLALGGTYLIGIIVHLFIRL